MYWIALKPDGTYWDVSLTPKDGYTEITDEQKEQLRDNPALRYINGVVRLPDPPPPPTFEQNKASVLASESAKFAMYAAASDKFFSPEYLKKIETSTLKPAKQAERNAALADYKIAKGLWDTYEAQLLACTTQEQLDSATTMNFEDAVTTAKEAWWFKVKSFFGF